MSNGHLHSDEQSPAGTAISQGRATRARAAGRLDGAQVRAGDDQGITWFRRCWPWIYAKLSRSIIVLLVLDIVSGCTIGTAYLFWPPRYATGGDLYAPALIRYYDNGPTVDDRHVMSADPVIVDDPTHYSGPGVPQR